MKKSHQDLGVSNKALIGGIVGMGALTVFLALQKGKRKPLGVIGETISHVGEILKEHNVEEPVAMKSFEKNLHKHEDTLNEVVGWVATGISLWNKFKG